MKLFSKKSPIDKILDGLFVEKQLIRLLFELYKNIHTIYDIDDIKFIANNLIPLEEQKKIILPAISNDTSVIVRIRSSYNCFTFYVIDFITKKVVFNHTCRYIINEPDIFFNQLINKIGFYIREENCIVIFDISIPNISFRHTYLLKFLSILDKKIITVQDVCIADDDKHIIVKSNEGTLFLEITF